MTQFSGTSARNTPDSATLYAGCRSQDPAAQTAAYNHLWAYLYRVALRVVRNQPDPESLAQDCAQNALITVYERIETCHGPDSFKGWARRIAFNESISELRKRKRLIQLEDDDGQVRADIDAHAATPSPERQVQGDSREAVLRDLLAHAPISDRAKRVIIGRYLDDQPEEALAAVESELSGNQVEPRHIQVTRSKGISRLRQYERLLDFLDE